MKLLFFSILLSLSSPNLFAKTSRLKDLVQFKGVRENPIIGYGLVIGLNGTGDSESEVINSSLKRMFSRLGLNLKKEVSSKNVASVVVTAKLPPFGRIGQKINVTVSSIGDASSLAGGTLLVTSLKGGDENVYAVASGSLSIGGLNKGRAFPTTALIPSGATIEKEIDFAFSKKKSIRLSLNNPDFTTSARIEKVINQELGGKYATSKDATTIDLIVPIHYQRKVVQLMAIIENFKVNTDQRAKIIINERTGTIVAGGDIIVSPVAISHGDLNIEIKDSEGKGSPQNIHFLEKPTTLGELVKSLNAIGALPEDLISIFQALKKNGALIGEIEII